MSQLQCLHRLRWWGYTKMKHPSRGNCQGPNNDCNSNYVHPSCLSLPPSMLMMTRICWWFDDDKQPAGKMAVNFIFHSNSDSLTVVAAILTYTSIFYLSVMHCKLSTYVLSHVVLIFVADPNWFFFSLSIHFLVIYLHLLPDWVFSNADAAMEWNGMDVEKCLVSLLKVTLLLYEILILQCIHPSSHLSTATFFFLPGQPSIHVILLGILSDWSLSACGVTCGPKETKINWFYRPGLNSITDRGLIQAIIQLGHLRNIFGMGLRKKAWSFNYCCH